MEIAGFILSIVGLVGKVIPPLGRWLGRKTGGYSIWKSEITYWAGRRRSVSRRFFGRNEELKAISEAFKSGRHVALSGGPGIGKSQLAAEFAQKSKRKGFWTPGGESSAQTIIALAPHLGINRGERGDDEVFFQTRRRLQAMPAKTLWVIDNLSDLDQLNELLNETGKISLLVTTQDGRENVIPGGVDFQTVGVLDPESAVRLLCRSGRHDPKQSVFLEIVEEVGRLPRAVEALAVQLDSPGETPERLLEELRDTPNTLELDRFRQHTGGLQIPQPESLFNALRGPVDALPDDIRVALAPLGYTADIPIPVPLAVALTGLNGGTLVNFFDQCAGRSVLTATDDEVSLHSLTAAIIVATNLYASLPTTLERASRRLATFGGSGYPIPTNEFPHYGRISDWANSEIDQANPALLSFNNNLAVTYAKAGRHDDAARIYSLNLEIEERVLGSEHPHTLGSRNNLAATYSQAGRYREAAQLHSQTLEAQERVLGPEHPDTLLSRSNLAGAYTNSGRYDDAAQLHRQTLEARERVLGPDHPDTLKSRNYLAATYGLAERYDKAVPLLIQTLEDQERILGPDHPDTLISLNNLAATYGQDGNHPEAAQLLNRTVEARERVLGSEHPDTLTSRSNLANAFASAGKFDDAAKLHRETLEARERILGSEHPDTLTSYNNLGTTYGHTGNYDNAVQLLSHALKIWERDFGPDHPDTVRSRNNLALALRALSRNAEADALFNQD